MSTHFCEVDTVGRVVVGVDHFNIPKVVLWGVRNLDFPLGRSPTVAFAVVEAEVDIDAQASLTCTGSSVGDRWELDIIQSNLTPACSVHFRPDQIRDEVIGQRGICEQAKVESCGVHCVVSLSSSLEISEQMQTPSVNIPM